MVSRIVFTEVRSFFDNSLSSSHSYHSILIIYIRNDVSFLYISHLSAFKDRMLLFEDEQRAKMAESLDFKSCQSSDVCKLSGV